MWVARSIAHQEVDPEVLIPAARKRLRVGNFYDVKITDSDDYDLFGTVNK